MEKTTDWTRYQGVWVCYDRREQSFTLYIKEARVTFKMVLALTYPNNHKYQIN